MKTYKKYKDFLADKLVEMGVEDHQGKYYSHTQIFNNLEDFLDDVSKEELIEWADEFKNEKL